jgi:phage-related protein
MTITELMIMFGIDSGGARSGATEVNNAQKSVEDQSKSTGSTMGKSYDEAGGHVSKLGSLTSGIFMGMGMAITNFVMEGPGKVVDVLKDAEKAYQDAAVSTAKLDTAMKNNVPGLSNNAAKLAGVASAADKAMESNLNLGYSMDDQRDSMSILVGVTKDTTQAQKDMSEAMDLARLKGVDLASATNIVMKAQEGNTGALKKLGIVVAPVTTAMDKLTASHKNATAAQIAAAKAADLQATETAALTGITKLAGGQAEAYADTSAGKLAAAHAKVTEAMVKLGSITDQIVQAVLPPLADAFDNIMTAVGPVLDQIGTEMPAAIATVSGVITTLVSGAMAGLQTALDFVATHSDEVKGALVILGGVVAAVVVPPFVAWAAAEIVALAPIIAIGVAVAAAIAILYELGVLKVIGQWFDDLSQRAMPAISAAFAWLTTNVLPPLQQAFTFITTTVLPALSAAIQAIVTAALPPIQTAIEFITTTVLPALSKAFDFLTTTVLPALSTVIGAIVKAALPPIQTALGFITTNVLPALGSAFGFLTSTVFPALGKVLNTVTTVYLAPVKVALQFLTSTVLPALVTGFDFLTKTVFPAVGSAIGIAQTAFSTLGTVVSNVWSGISTAVKGAVNIVIGAVDAIIKGINSIQLHINLSIPNPLGGTLASMKFDWDGVKLGTIPTMHTGGVVPGPVGADVPIIAQAGEGVVSVRDMAAGSSKSGSTYNVTINNPTAEPASQSAFAMNMRLAALGYIAGD